MYHRLAKLSMLLIMIALVAVVAAKVLWVDRFIGKLTGSYYYGGYRALANDAPILLSLVGLFYLSILSRVPRIVSVIFRLIFVFGFALYTIDLYVLKSFSTHLTLDDALKYSSYSLKYLQQNLGGLFYAAVPLVIAGLFALYLFITRRLEPLKPAAQWGFMLSFAVLVGLAIQGQRYNENYIHSWIYANVIDYNLSILPEKREYSTAFKEKIAFQERYQCVAAQSDKPRNVIILMVESLSNYQSKYFSGIRDWMPNLDRIASQNRAFVNFHANGFTTEDGEISLLTGKLPIYQPSSFSNNGGTSFNGFFDVKGALPELFDKAGYVTEFLTTADLGFANTGSWAKSIGFSHVEGHETLFYDQFDRFHFNAAPDKALYQRILQRLEANQGQSGFYFIKTVSTHHPYLDPTTMERTEAAAFKYADRELGAFYDQLKSQDYFNDGVLVIVGDHHAMVPIKREEFETYGDSRASAMVPLIIIDSREDSAVANDYFQQVDVFNTLSGMLAGSRRYSDWHGDLDNVLAAKFIGHRRGDNRNHISVFTSDSDVTVALNGDETDLTLQSAQGVSAADRLEILNGINSARILDQRTQLAVRIASQSCAQFVAQNSSE